MAAIYPHTPQILTSALHGDLAGGVQLRPSGSHAPPLPQGKASSEVRVKSQKESALPFLVDALGA